MAYFIPSPKSFTATPNLSSNPWVTGFEMSMSGSLSGNYVFNIAPGAARAATSDYVISYTGTTAGLPPSITVDVGEVGINGCFPYLPASLGLASATIFPVYAVSNSSGTFPGSNSTFPNTGVVVATGDNFLPPSYDQYVRIGLIHISNSGFYIIPWIQEGSSFERYYNLSQPINVLSGGALNTFQQLDLTTGNRVVPPLYNTSVSLNLALTNATDGQRAYISPINSNNAQNIFGASAGSSNINTTAHTSVNSIGNASIGWRVDSTNQLLNIGVTGFKDFLRPGVF